MMERTGIHIKFYTDQVISHASESAIFELMHKEVKDALTNDADLRILVRECVRDAIAKLNIQEVVALAVSEELQAQRRSSEKKGEGEKI